MKGPQMCLCTLNTSVFIWLASANSFSIYIRWNCKQNGWDRGTCHLDPRQSLFPSDNFLDVLQDSCLSVPSNEVAR